MILLRKTAKKTKRRSDPLYVCVRQPLNEVVLLFLFKEKQGVVEH